MGLHSGGKVVRLCLRFFILIKLWILVVGIWHFYERILFDYREG